MNRFQDFLPGLGHSTVNSRLDFLEGAMSVHSVTLLSIFPISRSHSG